MRYAHMVIGPAGSGKSTYCEAIAKHCEAVNRVVHVVNLDPAAEVFNYPVAVDVRDLISLSEVMEELEYGPNGGLVYCMEYLVDNLEWLKDQLGDFDNDYYIFDCPGQIELYSHVPVMRRLVNTLQQWDFRVCCVYCMDSQFIVDNAKFVSGCLACLAAMIQFETPHISVLTKMDLVKKNKRFMSRFYEPDARQLVSELDHGLNPAFSNLNQAIGGLVEDYGMVSFWPLNCLDSRSLELVLSHIDNALQWGEDQEPKEPTDEAAEDAE